MHRSISIIQKFILGFVSLLIFYVRTTKLLYFMASSLRRTLVRSYRC